MAICGPEAAGDRIATAPPEDGESAPENELSSLLRRGRARARPTQGATFAPSAHVGWLGGFDADDAPLLESTLWRTGELRRAQTTLLLETDRIGARVVFLLEDGDLARPIVIGVLREPGSRTRPGPPVHDLPDALLVGAIDEQRLRLEAGREMVLRCGAASITLTRTGKIIIKGTHVVSSSSGSNRIKGAAIDIN